MKLSQKTATFLFILIIILAIFLRFYKLELAEFKYDEAYFMQTAKDAVEKMQPPLVGSVSSVGTRHPAGFIYFMMLLVFISKNPLIVSSMFALLNVLGIVILYFLLKKHFSTKIALIASLFVATSPYAVIYSRKIWQPDIVSFFIIIFMFFFYRAVFDKDRKSVLWSLIALGVVMQMHTYGLFFLAFAPFLYYYSAKMNVRKLFFIGIALILLMYIPYARYELTHNFENVNRYLDYSKNTAHFNSDAFVLSLNSVSARGYDYFLGGDSLKQKVFQITFIDFLAIFVYLYGIGFAFFRAFRKNPVFLARKKPFKSWVPLVVNDKKTFFILLWLFVPILVLLFPKSGVFPHYLTFTYPAQWIIMAILLGSTLDKSKGKWAYWGIMLVILLIAARYTLFTISVYDYVDNTKYIHADYGTPVKYKIDELKNADSKRLNDLLGSLDYQYLYSYYLKKDSGGKGP
jgi:4-amino-4-deoxy-L-arabinose transferase-like glycosyltransferase